MYEITVSKVDLLPKLLMVAGAVDKRQSLALLSNILITANQHKLILTATDLEIEISAEMHSDTSLSDMQTTVPAKKFIDIIRALDDKAEPKLKFQEGAVSILSERSRFKLSTLPADQFPSCEKETPDLEFSINRTELIHLLESTHFAMSQQDVRVFLNGLLFEFDGNRIVTVGTDGHRMAICKLSCETMFSHHRLLLPRKGVLELLRLLNSIDDETVTIMASKSTFRLKCQAYYFTSKLIEFRFPPYHKAIPQDNDKFVLVDRDQLKKAISRILILANEKSRAVLMQIQPTQLTLIANNQEQEEATESLEATVDGQDITIGMNATYLLDVLQFMPDGLVRMSLSTEDRSILVESLADEQYQYVIMPMTI